MTRQVSSLIACRNLDFSYGRTPLFSGLQTEIQAGEMVGIIGPNGTGKSTLIRLLAGLLKPSAGQVHIAGKALSEIPVKQRAQRIAYVPQRSGFAHPFTVMEIVLMGRYPYQRTASFETAGDIRVATEALRITGTEPFENRLFDTLSGGEQQRVILASAIAQEPDILLLDEPTSSLDLHFQVHILNVLKTLHSERNITVVVALHDINLAASYCRRILLIDDHHNISDGPPETLLTMETVKRVFRIPVREFQSRDPEFRYLFPVYGELSS